MSASGQISANSSRVSTTPIDEEDAASIYRRDIELREDEVSVSMASIGASSPPSSGSDSDGQQNSYLTPDSSRDAENNPSSTFTATVQRNRRDSLAPVTPPPTPPSRGNGVLERRISAVQEVSGRAITESEVSQPNINENSLLMRRDFLQNMLDGINQEITHVRSTNREASITLPSANIDIDRASELEGVFQANSIGSIVSIDNGSIIIKVKMSSLQELSNFLCKRIDGTLLTLIVDWLKNTLGEITNVTLQVDEEQCKRVERYFARDCLDDKVNMTFCPVNLKWYWSHDAVVWHHAEEIFVREGPAKGKRLPEADLQMINKLGETNSSLYAKLVNRCALCPFGNRPGMIHPEYQGNVDAIEIDVRITYAILGQDIDAGVYSYTFPPKRGEMCPGIYITRPNKRAHPDDMFPDEGAEDECVADTPPKLKNRGLADEQCAFIPKNIRRDHPVLFSGHSDGEDSAYNSTGGSAKFSHNGRDSQSSLSQGSQSSVCHGSQSSLYLSSSQEN